MTELRARIENSFSRQSMLKTLGAEIVSVEPGRVVLAAPILSSVRQQHGFAHAAVAFALGDSAAGYSALSLLDEDREVLTSEMKINLLAPAKGDRIVAEGHVIRAGRRLIVVGAMVSAIDGDKRSDIAVLQGTMVPV